MVELKIDLSWYPERFEEWTELILDKQVNFILGKNWTWKSTIAKTIKNNNESVFLFDWYHNIIKENESLDAIALWVENVELAKQIKEIDKKIKDLNKDINPEWKWNLWEKCNKAKNKSHDDYTKLQTFLSDSASEIKNISDPQIAKPSYNKNDFEKEIGQWKEVDDGKIKELKGIINAEKKKHIDDISCPELSPEKLINHTNRILQRKINVKVTIQELEWNDAKQNFAREWMRIHEHKEWEVCSFCWNVISEKRWEQLYQFFNDEVDEIENDIDLLLQAINKEKDILNSIKILQKDLFYDKFKEEIESINISIDATKNSYLLFLNQIEDKIKVKQKNLFKNLGEISNDNIVNFTTINKQINDIIIENNQLSDNLEEEKDNARKSLRYNEIQKIINNSEYESLKAQYQSSKAIYDELNKQVEEKKQITKNLIKDKTELLEKTKDESIISHAISKCLQNSWIESFTLEHISEENNPGWKWLYKVRWHDWTYRSVKELSEWEKNIVAFLYFYFSLKTPENERKPNKIIIFDDPMTSNDDTLQYLMISKIKEIYTNQLGNDWIFLLLTHNVHFYLNVRPHLNPAEDDKIKKTNEKIEKQNTKIVNKNEKSWLQPLYHEKNNYYKLTSNWIVSKINKIKSYQDDFKSNYHALREDLEFLYKYNKVASMLNNCRRILETFINFNKYNVWEFYKWNEEAKQLFDVNSHSIEDLENELNWKTCKQIIILFKKVFEDHNAWEHFKSYFNIDINQTCQEQN